MKLYLAVYTTLESTINMYVYMHIYSDICAIKRHTKTTRDVLNWYRLSSATLPYYLTHQRSSYAAYLCASTCITIIYCTHMSCLFCCLHSMFPWKFVVTGRSQIPPTLLITSIRERISHIFSSNCRITHTHTFHMFAVLFIRSEACSKHAHTEKRCCRLLLFTFPMCMYADGVRC